MYRVVMEAMFDVVYIVAHGLDEMKAEALKFQLDNTLSDAYLDSLFITSIKVEKE